jgi:nitrile hydratase subunit beta
VNGVHDVGGMHGFGRVAPEPNEPVFHAAWEARVLGVSRACSAQKLFNIDESRHAIERMRPADYLSSSYYERWLDRTVRLLVEKGVITAAELERRISLLRETPPAPAPASPDPDLEARMLHALRARPDYRRPGPPPRFRLGDRIVTRQDAVPGHTRLPRYARGKRGVIHAVHGSFIFPDTNAHGQGEQAHPLYSVEFEAAELWGESAEPRTCVHLDLWERYLEPVSPSPRERRSGG